jgi:lipopolysaccharide biosynthesis glycosyltransferase
MTPLSPPRGQDPIRIFIGYDPRETVAWHVLCHSILTRASKPVSFIPLALHQLKDCFWRERDPLQSTDFSFTRFLTPYLSGYQGWSLFMDCDMLVRADIAELWDMRDDRYAVMCVKHDHNPKETVKFLGAPQTPYGKKNWSSVMLFNNKHCRSLTPNYINQASGLELHQFKWLENDNLIGELPSRWNHLVGYEPPNDQAAVVHYTIGGPYFSAYQDCEFAEEWALQRDQMLQAD